MITAESLTKNYGAKTAVDDISFTAAPGRVTGFLGPNGAGKSTTMRMAVGLDTPTRGGITVNGRRFAEHTAPLREVGAVLDAGATHPGRTARGHLRILAATHGIPKARVDEVIGMTGLDQVAAKRIKGFSLGMNQRLGIAAALLGDPATLIFDEPVNGLDPEGVRWVRRLTRRLADEGRTVFLSSHLMAEMAQTADHVIVLGRGRIIADLPIQELIDGDGEARTLVRSEEAAELARALSADGVTLTSRDAESFEVTGMDPRAIGRAALRAGLPLHELTPLHSSLEDSYMQLTEDSVEYRSGGVDAVTQEGARR
ncbi:MAG: ATP-binding cassette domain-containing protein [Nesterenkonia sp.]|uniref:ATP-binding cassette domain-containing protein n=1 Tax=Nesterenkonia marinintestina TaxID=2979865 RepID=UPI0021BED1E7|nr:ATP-binding cassette domain-containing protein [Nesterenkonia sp. GX14115]MDO5492941.1 ATP-binding cassette domain-containing protein [Nesterenkonia sp.]